MQHGATLKKMSYYNDLKMHVFYRSEVFSTCMSLFTTLWTDPSHKDHCNYTRLYTGAQL